MNDVAGVQDVFCGPLTVVHMKKGSAPLDTEALSKKLTDLKVVVESIARDDSAML